MNGPNPSARLDPGRDDFLPEDGGSFEPNLVFVAMPFEEDGMVEAYEAIDEECSRLGLRTERIDAQLGPGLLVKQITNLVRRAEFLLLDLTGEGPAVCYALGYAHGVGNEAQDVLLIAREDAALDFDFAPLRVRRYSSLAQLRSIAVAALDEMMQQTRR